LNSPAITLENLVKNFEDVTAVNRITLQVKKGELFGLLGPNGAGKTTIINILCGLIKPTNGAAKVSSFDVQKETAEVKKLIGVCPQETAIYPYLTGAENVDLFGNLHLMNKNELKKRRYKISSYAVKKGLKESFWPGRMEFIPTNYLLDCAHNHAGKGDRLRARQTQQSKYSLCSLEGYLSLV